MISPTSAKELALRFTASVLQGEWRDQGAHFDRLDRLYSEFFFLQNDHIRFLHRIGDITTEERDAQWAEVDAQEAEWEDRLDAWRSDRFCLTKALTEIQTCLRELSSTEVSRDAA